MSATASIAVSKNYTIHLTCLAHAAYHQKVTASFKSDFSSPVAVFTGTGENVAMTSNGATHVSVGTGSNTKLYAKFEFSKDGTTFQDAVKVLPPVFTYPVTTTTSEDSVDSDDNDSYFLVIDTGSSSK